MCHAHAGVHICAWGMCTRMQICPLWYAQHVALYACVNVHYLYILYSIDNNVYYQLQHIYATCELHESHGKLYS